MNIICFFIGHKFEEEIFVKTEDIGETGQTIGYYKSIVYDKCIRCGATRDTIQGDICCQP